jgi:hypothetical protein
MCLNDCPTAGTLVLIRRSELWRGSSRGRTWRGGQHTVLATIMSRSSVPDIIDGQSVAFDVLLIEDEVWNVYKFSKHWNVYEIVEQ